MAAFCRFASVHGVNSSCRGASGPSEQICDRHWCNCRAFRVHSLLACVTLLALIEGIHAQDLFISSERTSVGFAGGDDGLLKRLWAAISKSNAEEREREPAVRKYIDFLDKNMPKKYDETTTGATNSSASAKPRRLPADDGSKSSLRVTITVFGELGTAEDQDRPFDERRKEAEPWNFVVLAKSMTTGRPGGATPGATDIDFDSLPDAPPDIDFYVTNEFDADPHAPGGVLKDHRSPLKRSHFVFTINSLRTGDAKQLAQNFCEDYKEDEDVLLQAFVRALENSDLYPAEGFSTASNLGIGLGSFIHLNAEVFPEGDDSKSSFACVQSQPKPTSNQGALLLPDCPENAKRCSERPSLCDADERTNKPWKCKCLFGYSDKIKLIGVQNSNGITERFHYKGTCEKTKGYCKLQNARGEDMVLPTGQPVLGTVGEVAQPKCADGYFNTGTAQCVDTSRKEGTWTPDRWCKFDPPNEPPLLDCPEPNASDTTLVAKNCRYCRAGDPPWLPISSCQCRVTCADNHKEITINLQGPKKCRDVDLAAQNDPYCSFSEEAWAKLEWLPLNNESKRCKHKGSEQYVHDFCCRQAWGPNLPKKLKAAPGKCRSIVKDDACLSHYQTSAHAPPNGEPPCCWNELGFRKGQPGGPGPFCTAQGDGEMITADPQTRPQACAVRKRIPKAMWEDFPICVKKCDDIFSKHSFLVSKHCNNCVPGESILPVAGKTRCKCEVLCQGDLIEVAGQKLGPRQCNKGSGTFDPAPVCIPPEETPKCNRIAYLVNYTIVGCQTSPAGCTLAKCPCDVQCTNGYKLVGSVPKGPKLCLEKPKPLNRVTCDTLTDWDACMRSQSSDPSADGVHLPCCWRSAGFGSPGRRCVAMKSEHITVDAIPEKCADQRMAEWEYLPTCRKKCQNIFVGVANTVEKSAAGACDECIAEDPDACLCRVECKPGAFRVGGGPVGDRKCIAGAGTGDPPSFGQAPVCMVPEDNSEAFIPDTTEVKSKCTNPLQGAMGRFITGCQDCQAGDLSCYCKVECTDGWKNTGTDSTSEKKCREVPNPLVPVKCTDISTRDGCLKHSQKDGDQQGQPCCWNQYGFNSGDNTGPKCVARMSPEIGRPPEKCANTLMGKWDDFPTCVEKCPNIFKYFKTVEHKDCDNCIPDEFCPCQARCAIPKGGSGERLVRVGGGREDDWEAGEKRQCPASLQFEAPPVCVTQQIAGLAKPPCDRPASHDVSLSPKDCGNCVADDKACKCQVDCASGYKQTPKTIAAQGKDLQGPKFCKSIPATLKGGKLCKDIEHQRECLESKDSSAGSACCWREKGYLKLGGDIDPNIQCAPINSDFFGVQAGTSKIVAPDQCASVLSHEWDTMPTCHQLCINSYKGLPNLDVSKECDECYVDAEFRDDCQCDVNCEEGVSTFFAGQGSQGRRTCGTDAKDLRQYPPAPRCVPTKPPDIPVCDKPDHQNYARAIVGCSNCEATKDTKPCPTCDVQCADTYKRVGGTDTGLQTCKQEIYRCPKLLTWNQEDRSCTDRDTGHPTNLWCCGRAHFEPKTDMTQADCSTITDRDTCKNRLDNKDGNKQCCWRELKYKNGKQCAADESADIDDQHLPDECSNRPMVLSAEWVGMPDCEKKCEDIFSLEKDSNLAPLIVNQCHECVASDPGDCKCTVNCEGPNYWVGGGPDGPRTCDASGFGKLPMCMEPEPPLMCAEPRVDKAIVTDCKDCEAGKTCSCKVRCLRQHKDMKELADFAKKCNKNSRDLNPTTCTSHNDKRSCLDSKDTGPGQHRCCWRRAGFSRTEHDGGKKCVPEFSDLMEQTPTQCAPKHNAEWDAMPECKPKCQNVFKSISYLTTTDECDECVAGEPCPKCIVDCKGKNVHVGGGKPKASWTCTEDQLEFQNPPMCWGPEQAPLCPPPSSPTLEVQGCLQCTAGAPCKDSCKVYCAPRHLQVTLPSVDNTGPKKCDWFNRLDLKTDACANNGDSESKCLGTKEDGEPCCWHKDGLGSGGAPKCAKRGDPAIQKFPERCTQMKVIKWDEMPQCKHRCEHTFHLVPNIKFVRDNCNNACYQGGPCACRVDCMSDQYERIGGGLEGPRSCTNGDYHFEEAPACMMKPPIPVCDVSRIPSYIKASSGCENCLADHDCPSCTLSCQTGFQKASGSWPVDKKLCQKVTNNFVSGVDNCEEVSDFSDCVRNYQKPLSSSRPCCYHGAGFGTPSVVCTAMHSEKLKAIYPPDQCAILNGGIWVQLPECKPECPNIFRDVANIVQDRIGDCDHCIVGGACNCNVQCVPGTFPFPGSGRPGPRTCNTVPGAVAKPSFDAAPQCEPMCQVPDDKLGTLNLAECQRPCFPGYHCDCKISCAKGNAWSGGGPDGELVRCVGVSQTAAMWQLLPVCNPVCEPPDDQFQTLDTSRCKGRCLAGDDRCSCYVKCYGAPMDIPGAGQPGYKRCMFFAGDQTTPATAKWVNHDVSTHRVQPGWDAMPNCMSPIVVNVLDARDQAPVEGAVVSVHDKDNRGGAPFTRTTNKDGMILLHTNVIMMQFEVVKEGYSRHAVPINRLEQCINPAQCFIQFNINKKMLSGDIHQEGCFFTAKPGKANWQMRAILSWNPKPADLDIWVRQADCAEDARKRYQCWDEGDPQYKGAGDASCQRTLFTKIPTRDLEKQACKAKICRQHKNPDRTAFKETSRGPWPDCPVDNQNQFFKWVFWGSQYVDRLAHRILPNRRVTKRYPDWTDDNYLVLDTDKRSGKGPETVTFVNAPPGTYQVAVDQFSTNEDSLNIKDGVPYITLFIGGNDVMVLCDIEDSCKENARVWNAVNIKIEKMNQVHTNGEDKYSIRIIDEKEHMQKLHPSNLPTNLEARNVQSWVPTTMRLIYKPRWEFYFATQIQEYTFQELNNVCYGKCRMAEGSEVFSDCLERKETVSMSI